MGYCCNSREPVTQKPSTDVHNSFHLLIEGLIVVKVTQKYLFSSFYSTLLKHLYINFLKNKSGNIR